MLSSLLLRSMTVLELAQTLPGFPCRFTIGLIVTETTDELPYFLLP